MPIPNDLIFVARLLAKVDHAESTDAQRRRAVSTAYYAVFHSVLRTAADRFVGGGQQNTSAYRLLYRSFDHGSIRTVCGELVKSAITEIWAKRLGRTAVTQEFRDFATIFISLQEARQRADYDPAAILSDSTVNDRILDAETAVAIFDRVPHDERTDILAR